MKWINEQDIVSPGRGEITVGTANGIANWCLVNVFDLPLIKLLP